MVIICRTGRRRHRDICRPASQNPVPLARCPGAPGQGRAWQVTGGTLRYCCLAVTPGLAGSWVEGRISDTMSHATADRYAWIEPGVEDLGGGVHRIPLPLPMDGLKAGNVYAIADPGGGRLIHPG